MSVEFFNADDVALFQHTAARRRLGSREYAREPYRPVSTHSRPKAAGYLFLTSQSQRKGFNTQPPEGGWCATASAKRF